MGCAGSSQAKAADGAQSGGGAGEGGKPGLRRRLTLTDLDASGSLTLADDGADNPEQERGLLWKLTEKSTTFLQFYIFFFPCM